MTLVIERRVMRLSTELIDEIGKVVQGSITLYLQGGGLFHCLLVAPSLDATVGVRAVYWERNENRFRAIELSRTDVLDAEREWTAPAERRPVSVSGHAPICSCNECQSRRFAPQHILPSVAGEAQRALEVYTRPPEVAATAELAEGERAAAELTSSGWPLADLQMEVAALTERVGRLEAEVAALRLRTA